MNSTQMMSGYITFKKCIFGLTALLLMGGLAYTESTFNSSPQPPEALEDSALQSTAPEQLLALASGLKPNVRIGSSYAIKSDRHSGLWYVGVKVYDVRRGEVMTATWLMTGTKSNPGAVLSVDAAAEALSIWPKSQGRFSVSDADSEVWMLVAALEGR